MKSKYSLPDCSLSILVARTDVGYLRRTIPHIVRGCSYPFKERALIIDTAPLGSAYLDRPGTGTTEELNECCNALVRDGWIDRLHHLSYGTPDVPATYRKYFGTSLAETHDFRGYPVYGSLVALETAPTDLVVHFDSDMLIWQTPGFSWIETAADLMSRRQDILFAAPLSGPPRNDGTLHQPAAAYTRDPDGFYRFDFFTSRKFLVSRSRLLSHSPIKPLWISNKRKWLSKLTGKSALWSFEMMATQHMAAKGLCRADLTHPGAWTLHTPDHGRKFLDSLDAIIARVERGEFPPEQAGHYDLNLDLWTQA